MISRELTAILCCPNCKGDLTLTDISLRCPVCRAIYPIMNGIPRFPESDGYVSSFSFEWSKHKKSLLDSVSGINYAENMFFIRTGLDKSELKGKLILDAGCGTGRFAEVVEKYGGHVIGVDLSSSVEKALDNVPESEILQADIMNLPFKDESFDIVFAIGVIHHTYCTEKAFTNLARLVKPRGKLAVWVYSNDGWKMKVYNAVANFYRIFTTRMPPEILYKMCQLAIPLYHVHKIPVIGLFSRVFLSTSCEPIPEWRLLDTFDWYSPKYQFKHTYQEVDKWFTDNGFENITNLRVAVSVQGTKKAETQ